MVGLPVGDPVQTAAEQEVVVVVVLVMAIEHEVVAVAGMLLLELLTEKGAEPFSGYAIPLN